MRRLFFIFFSLLIVCALAHEHSQPHGHHRHDVRDIFSFEPTLRIVARTDSFALWFVLPPQLDPRLVNVLWRDNVIGIQGSLPTCRGVFFFEEYFTVPFNLNDVSQVMVYADWDSLVVLLPRAQLHPLAPPANTAVVPDRLAAEDQNTNSDNTKAFRPVPTTVSERVPELEEDGSAAEDDEADMSLGRRVWDLALAPMRHRHKEAQSVADRIREWWSGSTS